MLTFLLASLNSNYNFSIQIDQFLFNAPTFIKLFYVLGIAEYILKIAQNHNSNKIQTLWQKSHSQLKNDVRYDLLCLIKEVILSIIYNNMNKYIQDL